MGISPRRAITARACKALSRAIQRTVADSRPSFSASVPLSEPLEKRQMMTATSAAALRASSKLDSSLTALYQNYLQPSSAATNSADSSNSLLQVVNGSVELQAFSKAGDHSDLMAAIKRLKGTKVAGSGREVDALFPISSLGKLAKVKSLRFADAGAAVVNTGSVTSQGDIADQAANARSAFGINGAGVKIGIVSDSFNTSATVTDKYTNDVASGDLPSNVQILADGLTTGTDEGRAIAQVIYDSAPGASLAFATAGSTQATFASDIRALATAGAKIIVDDETNLYEPMFQDGIVAQAVTAVTTTGVTYISAAGNNGSDSYASSWRAGSNYNASQIPNAPGAPVFYGGTAFNFSTTGGPPVNMNSFTLGAGQSIKLSFQWDSPYFSVSGGSGSTNQLDAYVLNSTGTQIVGGGVNYDVGGDPIQVFQFTNTGAQATFNLMLMNENVTGGATPGFVKYVDFSGQATNWAYAPNSSTIFGHANAVGSETIGAAAYSNTPAYGVTPAVLETNSGTGGTPILFNSSGGKINTTRQEPALVGPDAVLNTFFGTKSGNTYTFSGTSAAAAGVAGVAALLLQKNPALTPAQLDSALQSKALPMGGTTPNLSSGYGLVQATASISTFVANITGTVFHDNNANGTQDTGETGYATVSVYIDSNNNGVLDAGEPITTTNANGSFSFFNQTTGSAVVRVVPPTGTIATVSGYPVSITAGIPFNGVSLGIFPIAFSSTTGGSTYTLQNDPTVTANIDIITPTTTYTAPKSLVPTLTFNLSGVGSNSLNINFSSGSPVPSGGLSFTGSLASGSNNALILNGNSGSEGFNVYGGTTFYNTSAGTTAGVVSALTTSNIQTEIINGNSGNDVFSVETAPPATLTNLTFNGGVGNDTLTIDDALSNNGAGTFYNAGTNPSDINTLNVNVGNFTFSGNPITTSANLTVNVKDTPNNLNISAGVIFSAGSAGSGINLRNLTALNISEGTYNVVAGEPHEGPPTVTIAAPATHTDRAVLVLGSLLISGVSILDLNANDMIVTNGTFGVVNSLLAAGYNNGSWNGINGIESSAAASDTTHLTALGIIQNNNAGSPFYGSGTPLGLFDGQNPGTSAILIKYTYYGDADLSGVIDGSDYSRVDSGFLQQATSWMNGDFNFDRVVDGSDYTLLDNAFNSQGSPLS